MDENNLDKIEEDLKKKDEQKKEIKKSGKSVFKLQEIIKDKAHLRQPACRQGRGYGGQAKKDSKKENSEDITS